MPKFTIGGQTVTPQELPQAPAQPEPEPEPEVAEDTSAEVEGFQPHVVRFRDDDRAVVCIVAKRTPLYVTVVMLDSPVKYRQIPAAQRRHMRDLDYKGEPYPVKRAVRLFKKMGKSHGIQTRAKRALAEL